MVEIRAGDSSIGPMAIANVSVDWSHLLFRVRASRTTSSNPIGPPEAAITDYSALVGGVVRTGPLHVHAAMGIGAGFVNLPIQLGVSLDSEHTCIPTSVPRDV